MAKKEIDKAPGYVTTLIGVFLLTCIFLPLIQHSNAIRKEREENKRILESGYYYILDDNFLIGDTIKGN